MCEQLDQYALRHVVSVFFMDILDTDLLRYHRHASIDPAVRAARGLPEDLIRLCVGIEDPHDLLDDLERALIDAGAIALDASQNKSVRVPGDDALTLAVQKLNLDAPAEDREWFVSAPGKVILFGEHAVVHGVVSSRFTLICVQEQRRGRSLLCGTSGMVLRLKPAGIDSTGVQMHSI